MGWSLYILERGNLWELFVRHVLQHIFHPAVQDFTQGVQRLGGNGFPVLHAVDGVGIHALLID